ncbi:lysozyme [Pseudaestuariivita rosea]|uniref:lysozyme n=1 Tax=Pseudaestuariivita rosea TaxID=2763263 RepID=UPI001ABB4CC9|nr:lysozyme [Pseudaestuariivita rosea]
MQITAKVALEIAHHEALVRQAYRDSVGVWTWSIGLTNASGHQVYPRYKDNPASLERCLEVYVWSLQRYADRVRREFRLCTLNEAQFAAALSFDFNTGGVHRATWVRLWNEGNIDGARQAFMNWRRPAEILPRREKERDLFFHGEWSNDGTVLEITRLTEDYRPIFASGVKRDIRDQIAALLAKQGATS